MTSPNNLTDQQVLEQVISRAIEGGWEPELPEVHIDEDMFGDIRIGFRITSDENDQSWWSEDFDVYSLNDIIFSHDFAKALWGEDYVDDCYGTTYEEYQQHVKDGIRYPIDYEWNDLDIAWGYHLKHMVISENPIDYLRQYLKESE